VLGCTDTARMRGRAWIPIEPRHLQRRPIRGAAWKMIALIIIIHLLGLAPAGRVAAPVMRADARRGNPPTSDGCLRHRICQTWWKDGVAIHSWSRSLTSPKSLVPSPVVDSGLEANDINRRIADQNDQMRTRFDADLQMRQASSRISPHTTPA
jgi:hypothetical protein